MLATCRMVLWESTVCSNKEWPRDSWVFWKTSHNICRWASQIPNSPPKEIFKNPKQSNASQISQSENTWWLYNKGHKRWDNCNTKTLHEYTTYSSLKHNHDFNSYMEMFFASFQVVDISCQNKKIKMTSRFLPSEKCLVNAMTGLFLSLTARYIQLNVKKTRKANLSSYS